MRNRIAIIVGIALGLIAVLLVHNYLEQQRRKVEQLSVGLEPTPVLVARQTIEPGQILSPELVELQQVPAKYVQPYAESQLEAVVGKRASVPITQGEQILRTKLELPTAGATMASKTPPGKRAVTIPLDEIAAVGGFIRPGDTVDILWVASIPRPEGGSHPITVTLFQNIQVLAVGRQLIDVPEQRRRTREGEEPSNTVTVALSPEETQLLVVAQEQGKLQLALRSRADLEAVPLPAASPEALLRHILPPEAFQRQEEAKQVEVFRGLDKEVVAVPQ